MQPTRLISSFIKVISLTYFIGTVQLFTNLPMYYSIFSHSSKLPATGQAGMVGLVSTGVQIAFHLIMGLILWFCSASISKLILKSVNKENAAEQDAAANP